MKQNKWKRITSALLALVLVLGNVPVMALAADDASNLCPHHEAHIDCGYVEGESECAYQCDACLGQEEPSEEPTEAPAEEPTEELAEEPQCYCAERCTADAANEYCDICAVDYTGCTGEEVAAVYAASGTFGSNNLLSWELTDDGTLTISGTTKTPDYTSSNYQTAIPWDSYRDSITKLVVEEGVWGIGDRTFSSLRNLTSVSLPDSLRYIEDAAFAGSFALSEVVLPTQLERIGQRAFESSGLESVTIPAKVTYIGQSAFGGCSDLTGFSVASGNNAFTTDSYGVLFNKSKSELIAAPGGLSGKYVIPDTVTSMEWYAFYGCGKLESVVIPKNLTSISPYAFYWCYALSDVTIQEGVTTIEQSAFYWCTELASITLPESLTTIEKYAFERCEKLESITLPGSLTTIGVGAFGYSGLKEVTFKGNAPTIGNSAFSIVTATCTYPADATGWDDSVFTNYGGTLTWRTVVNQGTCGDHVAWELDSNGLLHISGTGSMDSYEEHADKPWYDYADSIKEVIIDEGIDYIGGRAFSGCNNLAKVTIPGTVSSIGPFAFSGCSSLTSITIPNSVTTIYEHAFAGSGLTSVVIPDSVTTIWNSAFDGSDLTEVYIGSGVAQMGEKVFAYCKALETVRFAGGAPSTGANNVFAHSTGTVYYPNTWADGATNAICSYATWVSYDPCEDGHSYGEDDVCTRCGAVDALASGTCGENLTWTLSKDGVLTISGTGAMEDFSGSTMPWLSYCSQITSVVIENGVTSIGKVAFYACTNLTGVTIPNGVTSIGSNAFSECTSLANVTIPGTVTSIAGDAFSGCTGLTDVTIQEGVTSIGDRAFAYCANLATVTIPGSVTAIGSEAFKGCSALTEVTIQEGVTSIGDYAFYECTNLANLTLPDSVKSIGASVFFHCTSLTEVTIPGSLTAIGNGAFNGCTGLTDVTIQEGVTSIGATAFSGCTKLANVSIPSTVTSIGNSAFNACKGLTEVAIPDSVQSIGSNAFAGCTGLKELTIPASVTSIDIMAFVGCTGVTKITFLGNAPSFGNNCFGSVTATVYYPADDATWTEDKLQGYGGTLTWVFNAPTSGQCGPDAYWHYDGDGTLTITGTGSTNYTVNATYPWLTYYKDEITTGVIGEGITDLSAVFNGCSALETVTLPSTLKTMAYKAFCNCTSLEEIVLPDSVEDIMHNCFQGCTALKKISLSANLKNIYDYAFEGTALTEIVFPANVEYIGQRITWGINKDVTITFQGNAPEFHEKAFDYQKAQVYYPVEDTTWEGVAGKRFGGTVRWHGENGRIFGQYPASGTDLDSINWDYDGNGTLTFSGTGYIGGFLDDAFVKDVTTLVVEEGITGLDGNYNRFTSVKTVKLPSTLTALGNCALSSMTDAEITFIGDAPSDIDNSAFYQTKATAYYPAGNATWTEDKLQNYGGTITWICYMPSLAIIQQPQSVTGEKGETVSVQVKAAGVGLTYKWYFRNPGETKWNRSSIETDTYSVELNASRAGRELYCQITDADGNKIKSNVATIGSRVTIVTQPESVTVTKGEKGTIRVEAEGEGLTYKWYFRNPGKTRWNLSSKVSEEYSVTMTKARANREYYCVVTDKFGNKVTSDIAKIAVPELTIVTQPQSSDAKKGETATVSLEAQGEGLTYRWYFRNAGSSKWHVSSIKTNTYSVKMIRSRAGRELYCRITDAYGNKIDTDIVTIGSKLEITQQPQSVSGKKGETVTVTVKAEGEGLKYRWYLRNEGSSRFALSSITGDTYSVTMNKIRANRELYCKITDAYGRTVKTEIVTLHISE